MSNSNANLSAQRDFDTEMMDLLETLKHEAAELAASQTFEHRAFESKCLHEHSIAKRARY